MHTVMVCLFFYIYTPLRSISPVAIRPDRVSHFWTKIPVQRVFQCEKTLMNRWKTGKYVFGI